MIKRNDHKEFNRSSAMLDFIRNPDGSMIAILCLLGFAMPCGCCRTPVSSSPVEPPAVVPDPKIAASISVMNQPTGRYLHCSFENHGDRQIILGDGISARWSIKSLTSYHTGHWDTQRISQSHYMILQPIPASRLDSGCRIDTDQLSWDLSLDALKGRLDSAGSGKLIISFGGLCSADLYPRLYSVELILDLPLVAGSYATKEFSVPKKKSSSAVQEFSGADMAVTQTAGTTKPSSGPSVDEVMARMRAKRDMESGVRKE